MTDKEVQDIFAEELADKPTREALMVAHNRIALQILAGLAESSINAETWGLLKDTAYAKSRLCRFIGIAPDSVTAWDKDALREVIFLHKHWLEVFEYLYNNYENLDSEEFKRSWPSREEILDTKKELTKKYEKIVLQFATTKTILLNHRDFSLMDQTFTWALLAILGYERFKQFQEEFNMTMALLRKYKAELISPPA